MGSGGGTGGTDDLGHVGIVGTMFDAVLGTGGRVGDGFFRCGWEVDNILESGCGVVGAATGSGGGGGTGSED